MRHIGEFAQYVHNFFTQLRRSAEEAHSLQWGDIFRAVQDLENELIQDTRFDIFSEHIFNILLAYDCPDAITVVRLLYFYFLKQNQYFSSRRCYLNPGLRRPVLRGIVMQYYTLEGMVQELIHPMTTLRVINRGDLKCMVLLILNGLSCPNFPGTIPEYEYGEHLLAQILVHTKLGANMREFRLEDLVKIILYPYLFDRKAISLQRALMVVWVLEAVRRRRVGLDSVLNYVKCLRILFTTIPEPFISVGEVQSFLHGIFIAVPREIQDAICVDVKKFFPESANPYQPRSLLHLSRCQARRSLLGNRPLPVVVNSLHIPRLLKHYLLVVVPIRNI